MVTSYLATPLSFQPLLIDGTVVQGAFTLSHRMRLRRRRLLGMLPGLAAAASAATAAAGRGSAVGTSARTEGSIPTPSAAQHRYQSTDFVALIHFNMGTFAINSDPACPSTLAA